MSGTADLVSALVALVSASADESARLFARADTAAGPDAKELRRQAVQWGGLADAGAIALARHRNECCGRREPSIEIPVLSIGME